MFRCRDLLALPTMTRAKLIAGENGLDREIRWSYKAEGMDFADWVHGREFFCWWEMNMFDPLRQT